MPNQTIARQRNDIPVHGHTGIYDGGLLSQAALSGGGGGGGSTGPTLHTLLDGYIHTDTTAQLVSRGALILGNSEPKWDLLTIGAATYFLKSDGTDAAWTSGAALTKTDDTNVTLTLGGSATTSLVNAASLTLGWTGQLAVSRGGSGASTLTGLLQGNGTSAFTAITNSSTVGQVLRVTGAATYAWGSLDLANTDAVGTSILAVANGGTGVSTLTANGVVYGSGTSPAGITAAGTTSQVLIGGTPPSFGSVPAAALDVDLQEIAAVANVRGDILVTDSGPTWVRFGIGSANQVLGVHATNADPEYKTIQGTASEIDVTHGAGTITIGLVDPVAVSKGGTGLASGTSGGVLGFTASGTIASSAALDANSVVIGGGAGATPTTTTTAAGILTWIGTPSSANLASAVTDETGTGALVFATSPTLVTPLLGTPTSGTLTNCTGLPIDAGTTGTLPVGRGGTGQTTQTAAFDALAPTTTTGDIIYYDGADNVRRGIGSSGDVLTVTGGVPVWAAPTGGTVDTARTWSTLQKFPDDKFEILGSATPGKRILFEADSQTGATRTTTFRPLSSSADRTISFGDDDYTCAGVNILNQFSKGQEITPDSDVVALKISEYTGGAVSNLIECYDDLATLVFQMDPDGNITSGGRNDLGSIVVNTSTATFFSDATTTTKKMYLDLSGTTANKSTTLTLSSTDNRVITFPDATTTLAGLAVAGTWTALQTFSDSNFLIVGSASSNRTLKFEVDSASANADLILNWAGTTDQTVTFPDSTTTLGGLATTQTWTGVNTFGSGAAVFGASADDETTPLVKASYQSGDGIIELMRFKDSGSTGTGGGAATNYSVRLALDENNALGSDIAIRLPSTGGTLVTSANTTTLTNKTLAATTYANTGAIRFRSNTTSTTNYFTLNSSAATGARALTLADEAGRISVTGEASVASGANATARAPGKVDSTGRTTDFASAQIVTSPTAGFWRLDSYLECTTGAAAATLLTTTWGWTDDVGATTDATQTLIQTATGQSSFSRVVYVASGHITIAVAATTHSTAVFAIRARATFLG